MNFPTKQSETAVVGTQRKEENDRPTRQLTNKPEGARKCKGPSAQTQKL